MNREQQDELSERSLMIVEMERILNPAWFKRRTQEKDDYCTLSTSQYWDWLTYIDDDYLTEWEVIKMKELYRCQAQELSGQFVVHTAAGWFASFFLMGPVFKGWAQNFTMRLPAALTFATFLGVQASNWQRPSKNFHEIMSQPAPHGSYLRRTLKEHFPVWWHETSAQLHANGYSLPEMNEYDR